MTAAPLSRAYLDRRQRGLDAFGVGDGAGHLVLGNVEIDANQGALAFEGEIFDEQFGHDFLESELVLRKAGIRIAKGMVSPYWLSDDSTLRRLLATALRKCNLWEGVSTTQTKYPWRRSWSQLSVVRGAGRHSIVDSEQMLDLLKLVQIAFATSRFVARTSRSCEKTDVLYQLKLPSMTVASSMMQYLEWIGE
jgi:hypothetical protein